MISILLPAYESDELLFEVFLSSLCNNLQQNYQKNELIIYDNGSNEKFVKYYKDYHIDPLCMGITIIGNGENVGLNAALNKCAKIAKGDYLYLPHTDMYLMPGWD